MCESIYFLKRRRSINKQVAVVGLGYVGLPLALLTAEKGYEVTGIDLDTSKNELINSYKSPITDKFVEERLGKVPLRATSDTTLIKKMDIVIVCVPTPVKNDFQPNLEPLKAAVQSVAEKMKKNTLVIIESTINPGVCDEIILPFMEKVSGLKTGKDFHLSHCPERINPGDEKWTVQNIPRVAGSYTPEGLKRTIKFYESVVDAAIKPMNSLKEAEAVKVVENSFRDINIAFVNELAMSFARLGINVKNVIDGAATKPFAFMAHYPGVGVGGHCIPVDPYYLIEYARQKGFHHEFLLLARKINNAMPEFTVTQLIDGLNEAGLALSQAKVAILGLSYKPNVGDDRESPSYKLVEVLRRKKVREVVVFDPYITNQLSTASLDKAIFDADAVILATAHREFININYSSYKVKVVIDGRNALSAHTVRKSGIIYRGIGS